MAHKYAVTTIESERGWGQKSEQAYFDTFEEAEKYRDHINSFNKSLEKGESVPDWYMIAMREIRIVEQ
jgi:hypothetical protein